MLILSLVLLLDTNRFNYQLDHHGFLSNYVLDFSVSIYTSISFSHLTWAECFLRRTSTTDNIAIALGSWGVLLMCHR